MYIQCRYGEAMITKLQKWGNSLAVRVPKAFASEMKIGDGASIEMMVEEGALVIRPAREGEWTLEALLAGVRDENIHGEWETGPPRGRETW
jgi:antitoxin MazE